MLEVLLGSTTALQDQIRNSHQLLLLAAGMAHQPLLLTMVATGVTAVRVAGVQVTHLNLRTKAVLEILHLEARLKEITAVILGRMGITMVPLVVAVRLRLVEMEPHLLVGTVAQDLLLPLLGRLWLMVVEAAAELTTAEPLVLVVQVWAAQEAMVAQPHQPQEPQTVAGEVVVLVANQQATQVAQAALA